MGIGVLAGTKGKLADHTKISAERNTLAVVIGAITDGVIVVDLKRTIVIFNSSAQKLTGFTKEEALGKPIDTIIKVFDGDRQLSPLEYCPVRIDSSEGVVFKKKGVKLVGKNKESFVNIIAGKITEAAAVNLGCILTLHDISEEKRLEAMRVDFVSMAAHELRTPLTSLRSYLAVFIEENKNVLNPEQKTFLSRMNTAASELTSLVENLLSASSMEKAKLTVSPELVDWKELVEETVKELQEKALGKGLTLVFTPPTNTLPSLRVDRIRLKEVLVNLLANAVNYTKAGGSVTVWIEENDGKIVTHVKDTGQGIPKEALTHLFTKFFRVSGSLEGGSKGTGLGLYISKAIMDLHHGKIWVESEVGKGSTFSFSLPTG